ncbi:MAG: 2-hydroxyacyl-CoA dehydratase family protein [Lachnospiraceae bacterium]|nr:2-hydroxyacyl-CoA dehydratase family protein [Lachnospiraceae bacterium]
MGVVTTYGNIIKRVAPNHPQAACRMIVAGLGIEEFRVRRLGDKKVPDAYKYLNLYALDQVREGLRHPEQTVWANLFSPVEILQCFDVYTLSIECLSSFLSGFTIENYFLDYAEDEGIAPTLCSYHKNFIGAVDSGVIPPAAFAVSTSTICDGNTNTFRYLAGRHDIPMFLIDIPDQYSPEAEAYVVGQLKELIAALEERFHRGMDLSRLSGVLERENESKASYERTLQMMKTKAYPSTLGLQMFMLFANHLDIGTPEILKFYRQMEKEVAAAPDFDGINLFWVHLLPYYQETLKDYLNLSDEYQIQGLEMSLDYRDPLDPAHPLESLAKKMICNLYNGSYERKADLVQEIAREIGPDGVINFCHWGCKQSSGGVMILKDKMLEIDTPLLILDGDALDRRNSHDGQIRTRFEAFLEIIRQQKGGAV